MSSPLRCCVCILATHRGIEPRSSGRQPGIITVILVGHVLMTTRLLCSDPEWTRQPSWSAILAHLLSSVFGGDTRYRTLVQARTAVGLNRLTIPIYPHTAVSSQNKPTNTGSWRGSYPLDRCTATCLPNRYRDGVYK